MLVDPPNDSTLLSYYILKKAVPSAGFKHAEGTALLKPLFMRAAILGRPSTKPYTEMRSGSRCMSASSSSSSSGSGT